ncbi:MAG: hypothetical protein K2G67_06705 [Muribaculaceae bacterium]|nr:hypothetical protein [Muribaculaceae bacterium]
MAYKTQIGNLTCLWARNEESTRIIYVLSPLEATGKWVDDASKRYDSSLVVITGMDWDNDLTPWPAPGVPAGSPDFKGLAAEFLATLRSDVIPKINDLMGINHKDYEYDLLGISLSGLFTLWQWVECDLFRSIASISGSFWYEGFTEWLSKQKIPHKQGRAYFSLGDQESKSPVPEFRSVGEDTESVISTLKSNGISTEFRSVRGNHFQYGNERLEMALEFLSKS